MKLTPIGRVRSPYESQAGTPIQPAVGRGRARVEIDPPFREALRDLEGFDRIWLLTWLDRAREFRPLVVPYRDTVERGLFSTRAPARPNPIGLSLVTVESVDPRSGTVEIGPVDLLDGTPVLDIKPYVPRFDAFPDAAAGWHDESRTRRDRADDRFEAE
jgi:tRNA-Thr(GGU) m(6)t(6)A37 methyltransferase TsaA